MADEKPHTHREHVDTYPNEDVAPESVKHPVRHEPGGHVQKDDINVSLVALIGAFAAVLLFVMIVLLQAWFYNWNEAERLSKLRPEPALQIMEVEHQAHLQAADEWVNEAQRIRRMPIELAMRQVAEEMRAGRYAPPAPAATQPAAMQQ